MINKAILVGRLTKDIELMQSKSGKKVVQFTLAVNRDKENSDFINCVAWEKTAELMNQYLQKGSLIAAEGTIRTRQYQDKTDRTVFVTEILVNQVQFLESKPKTQQQSSNYNIGDDDLPF